ncbi:hypothetical protein PtB15_5B432 [Puccinia triticina]|nr:hypothetical protein PtB15_5B432 [Puccinia triticina]
MCIAFWSPKNQLGYRLILASNRDEFLNRPSLPANWHSFEPIDQSLLPVSASAALEATSQSSNNDGLNTQKFAHEIISGRDSIAGGTWLGIDKQTGKFGFLTNVAHPRDHIVPDKEESDRSPQDRSPPASRGLIIQEFLQGSEGVESCINKLKSSRISKNMNGYNLVIGQIGKNENEQDRIAFFCNRNPEGIDDEFGGIINHDLEGHNQGTSESTLVYGFSNGIAHRAPIWPKVTQGRYLMEDCLRKIQMNANSLPVDPADVETELFNLLSTTDDSTEDLPCNILIRPHHRLRTPGASASIETWYATRTQTIVLVSQTTPTRITFVERDAFQIQHSNSPGDELGKPVWMGDDCSCWRRFEFQLPS